MKLSLVLAAAALAVPSFAAAVTAAPEITGVITPAHRQPFKPLPKNGTAHGLVNTTGPAAHVRGVWRPFADSLIQAPSRSRTDAAASMTADVASQAAPDLTQVPPKIVKGKRDMFKKTVQKNGGNNAHQKGTGTNKKKNDGVRHTAPHEVNNLPADFGTKSVGDKKPWARPSVGVGKGSVKQASAGIPKNAGRKFKEALAAKKAKASPQAPWTKKVDHGKGKAASSQSDRKAKKTTGSPKIQRHKFKEAVAAKKTKATSNPPASWTSEVHDGKGKAASSQSDRKAKKTTGIPKVQRHKFKEAVVAKKSKATGNPPASWTSDVHQGEGNTTNSRQSAGQTKTEHPPSIKTNHLPTEKGKTSRHSLAIAANTSRETRETHEIISSDIAPHPNQRRTSDTPFGIKKGIVYQDDAVTPSFSRDGSATWAYNWGAAPGAPMFQQIPMFWGPRDKGDAVGVMALVRAGAPWVLGYNEPDMVLQGGGGCEVSAGEAYDAWGIDMFPFYNEGARLVCPAVTSWNSTHGATNGPSGLVWLHEFVGYTTKPTDLLCDAQALHWYGVEGKSGREQADLFTAYVALAHDEINALFGFDMPLWITEFAAMPLYDAQVMAEFLDVALPWLDKQAYVERYSPFMADNMVDGQQLNVAGEKFVTWRGDAD
ncbi:glycosyl hydrolase catalytic core-domain-containing protein [Schizothecium vesticola]|uniref:Glycosyl hydrolase catalytic core-domain-containing protein n=1 Tax=Schizothecium vesticola TaxID=314040 RepID=A0AA40F4P1_9PEZI|nr:glycosyl hydrolase catalytic core-domain-containing protein [Schizothecium vesticola]